jgi:hypothetical protein
VNFALNLQLQAAGGNFAWGAENVMY